jgi:hypothetical protein
MDISIQYLGAKTDNYSRYGKTITVNETKITDVAKYYGLKDEVEAEARVKALEADKRILVKRYKGA